MLKSKTTILIERNKKEYILKKRFGMVTYEPLKQKIYRITE